MPTPAILNVHAAVNQLTIEQAAANALKNKIKGSVTEALRSLDIASVFSSAVPALDAYVRKFSRLSSIVNLNNASTAKAERELLIAKQRFEYEQKIASLRQSIDNKLTQQREREEAAQRRQQERIRQSNYAAARSGAISRLRQQTSELQQILGFDDLSPLQRNATERRLRTQSQRLQQIQSARTASSSQFTVAQLNRVATNTRSGQDLSALRNLERVNQVLEEQAKALRKNAFDANKFGEQIGLAAKRFSAFLIGSAPILLIGNALRIATSEAIKFEKSQTRLSQILQINRKESQLLVNNALRASQATGIKTQDIIQGIDILAQAGFQDITQLNKAIDVLSKVPLQATFGTIEETTEGLLSLLSQFPEFNKNLNNTEKIFDKLNRVAADYAVDVKDIFEGLKRGGSVFEQTGGKFDDFLELFTLLRSRSRESAETIGVFFKSIGFRLFRQENAELLRELGVTANTLPKAFKQLSSAFSTLFPEGTEGDPRALRIAEKLAGINQGGRFLTLLNAIKDDRNKFKTSLFGSSGSFGGDAAKRLDDIGVSLNRIQTAFDAVVSSLTQNTALRGTFKLFADFANVLADLGKNSQALLPLLTGIITIVSAPLALNVLGGIGQKIGLFGGSGRVGLADRLLPANDIYTRNGRNYETNAIRRNRLLRPFFNTIGSNNDFVGINATELGSFNALPLGVRNNLTRRERNRYLNDIILQNKEQAPTVSALSQIFPTVDFNRNSFGRLARRYDRSLTGRFLRSPASSIIGVSALTAASFFDGNTPRSRGLQSGLSVGGSIAALAPFTGPAAPFVYLGAAVAGVTVGLKEFNQATKDATETLKNKELVEKIRKSTNFSLSAKSISDVLGSTFNTSLLSTSLQNVNTQSGFGEQLTKEIRSRLLRGESQQDIETAISSQLGLFRDYQSSLKNLKVNNYSTPQGIRKFDVIGRNFDRIKLIVQSNEIADVKKYLDFIESEQNKISEIVKSIFKEEQISGFTGVETALKNVIGLNPLLTDSTQFKNRLSTNNLTNISNRLPKNRFAPTFALPSFSSSQQKIDFLQSNSNIPTSFLNIIQNRQDLINSGRALFNTELSSSRRFRINSALERLSGGDSDLGVLSGTSFGNTIQNIAVKFGISIQDLAKTLLKDGTEALFGGLEEQQNKLLEPEIQLRQQLNEKLEQSQSALDGLTQSIIDSNNKLSEYNDQIQENILDGLIRRNNIFGNSGNNTEILQDRLKDILGNTSISPVEPIIKNLFSRDDNDIVGQRSDLRDLLVANNNNEVALNNYRKALEIATSITDKFADELESAKRSIANLAGFDVNKVNQRDLRDFINFVGNIGSNGFGKLSSRDLNRFAGIAGIFGELPVNTIFGNNFNGINNTTFDKLQQELLIGAGAKQLAPLRSRITGESLQQSEQSIKSTLTELEAKRNASLKEEEQIRKQLNNSIAELIKNTSAKIESDKQLTQDQLSFTQNLLSFSSESTASTQLFSNTVTLFETASKNFDDAVKKFVSEQPTITQQIKAEVNARVELIHDVGLLNRYGDALKRQIEKAINEAFHGDINVNIPNGVGDTSSQ